MSHDNLPTFEPVEITIGEMLEWTKELADFPASEWELKYYFRGAGTGFDATATADGDTHEIAVPASSTAAMTAGQYYWEAWVTSLADPDEKHLADEGRVTVKRSFLSVTTATTIDDRTQAEIDLAAVRLALVPTSAAGVAEYEIAGPGGSRRLRYFSKSDLLDLEARLVRRVRSERRRARVRQGGDFLERVNARFDTPR